MPKTASCLFVIVLLIAAALSAPVELAAASEKRDVVILVVDDIGWNEWAAASGASSKTLLSSGALALSNNRSARDFNPASVYLTIGSGARAGLSGSAEDRAGFAFNYGEQVEDSEASILYERYTGRIVQGRAGFHLGIPSIIEQSDKFDYGAVPGALGEALKDSGLKVSTLGNADGQDSVHREAALIGMDADGIIPLARFDQGLTQRAEKAPFGTRGNIDQLIDDTRQALADSDLTIVDFGDTARVERARLFLYPEVLELNRRQAMSELDKLIGFILTAGRDRDLLTIIITPNANYRDAKEGRRLTPLLIHESKSSVGAKLIYSPSTRRSGIVLGTDIAPTILTFLGAAIPPHIAGRPLSATGDRASLADLRLMEQKIADTSLARAPILTAYITALIIFLAMFFLIIVFAWRPRWQTVSILRYLIGWLMSVPLVLIVLGAHSRPATVFVLAFGLPISLLLAALVFRLGRRGLAGIAAIQTTTAVVIIGDTLGKQVLSQGSVLGYDPVIGARFYGIGNEMMGLLVGSALIAVSIMLETKPNYRRMMFWVAAGILMLVAVIIGLPAVGANLDGTTTAVVAFAIALLKFKGHRLTPGWIVAVIGASLVAMSGVFVWDMFFSREASHLGQTGELIRSGDLEGVLLIVKRKVAINYKLLQWTVWSRVFILSLAVYALLFIRPVGMMKDFVGTHPMLSSGIISAVYGSIVAMFANDSGVVCGATTIMFAVLTQMYVIIDAYAGKSAPRSPGFDLAKNQIQGGGR